MKAHAPGLKTTDVDFMPVPIPDMMRSDHGPFIIAGRPAVMITDTELDADGTVRSVTVVRPPAAAKEVTPWVMALIRGASPFPAPSRIGEGTGIVWREIWLVDKSGRFQVDSLTEGQR
jgi:hypothetical protein